MINAASRNLKDLWAELQMEDHHQLLQKVRSHDEYLLIVLDACRYRDFRDLHHLFLDGHLKPAYTPARDTFEYSRLMWPGDHAVTYVSGAVPINSCQLQINEDGELNGLYEGYDPAQHLEEIVDVWSTGWQDDLGTVPPAAVTDAALDHHHQDQLAAHYFQPHAPYIGRVQLLGHRGEEHRPNHGQPNDALVWECVQDGEIPIQKLHAAYQANMIRVLKEVQRLVQQTRHRHIFITADHGEALGEYDVYAHPRKPARHPMIHVVPFFRVDT
jgi:hypothetical protein